MEGKARH